MTYQFNSFRISSITTKFVFWILSYYGAIYATQIEPTLPPLSKMNANCGEVTNGWGYSLDTLESDINIWRNSPRVQLKIIGNSFQNRPIYALEMLADSGAPKITIHARTHPGEWQSSSIVREIMNFLLLTPQGQNVLDQYSLYIIPMLNPDGVSLGCPRNNAQNIDLESAWKLPNPPPEVQALKKYFQSLMTDTSDAKIQVALNLHSSINLCTRFFFFHEENGTSSTYTHLQKHYIASVQDHFPGGIENWNFMTSWKTGNPGLYPESFFWENYQEKVMALTFEDSNCPNAGNFDKTGKALILGSASYLENKPSSIYTYSKSHQNKMTQSGKQHLHSIVYESRFLINGKNQLVPALP